MHITRIIHLDFGMKKTMLQSMFRFCPIVSYPWLERPDIPSRLECSMSLESVWSLASEVWQNCISLGTRHFIRYLAFYSVIGILLGTRRFIRYLAFYSVFGILLGTRHFARYSAFYSVLGILFGTRHFTRYSAFYSVLGILLGTRHFTRYRCPNKHAR